MSYQPSSSSVMRLEWDGIVTSKETSLRILTKPGPEANLAALMREPPR